LSLQDVHFTAVCLTGGDTHTPIKISPDGRQAEDGGRAGRGRRVDIPTVSTLSACHAIMGNGSA